MSATAGKRATIKDVAKLAGVSRSTTSRALTGNGYVAGDVAERVKAAAQSLAYVPDASARSLKQQRSRIIGIVVYDLRNHFYADLVAGAAAEARRAGYFVMTCDSSGEPDGDRSTAGTFVALRVAGVVMTPASAELGITLARNNIPVVEVDRCFSPETNDSVTVDNEDAARRLTEHLLDLGHTRIALIIDETDWTSGADRYRGYAEALAGRGLTVDDALVIHAGWDAEHARRSTVELLSAPSRPTALFAANNVLAEGAWRAVRDLGLAVPEDLSLVAFDDSPWMSMVTPQLTCIAQDSSESGRAAVRQLLQRIAVPDGEVVRTQRSSTLLLRDSTGRARPSQP